MYALFASSAPFIPMISVRLVQNRPKRGHWKLDGVLFQSSEWADLHTPFPSTFENASSARKRLVVVSTHASFFCQLSSESEDANECKSSGILIFRELCTAIQVSGDFYDGFCQKQDSQG